LKAYIIHLHGPIGFAIGVVKRSVLVEKGKGPWAKNYHYDKVSIIFFSGEGGEKRK
jgi:hypothetical protein